MGCLELASKGSLGDKAAGAAAEV